MNYRSFWKLLFTIAIVSLLLPAAWAQKTKSTGPQYDASKEVKVKGEITEIKEVAGPWEGTHLVVKTGAGTVLVHVGPSEFLKEMEMTFAVGDKVEVVGAKAPDTSEEEILAREITVGNNMVTLRDAKGIPIWADWKPVKVAAAK
jgi:DNA/RNA endonuclease YhcR with UshA esterase domain